MNHLTILLLAMLTPLSLAQGTHIEVGNLNGTRYADQFPSVQAALNALPVSGGEVRVSAGTYAGPRSIPNNNTRIVCSAWLACTFTYTSNVTFGSASSDLNNLDIDGIIFDFSGTAAGVTLSGVTSSHFRMQLQNTTGTALTLLGTTVANVTGNTFDWIKISTAGIGMVLNGDANLTGCGGTQVADGGAVYYNYFKVVEMESISGAYGMQFTSGDDSNSFGFVQIQMGAGNTTGNAIIFGSRCPSSYGDVVFEHFSTITVDALQGGYVGPFLQMNHSEGIIDNYVCGVNCVGGATTWGFNTKAAVAGNVNWQIGWLAGNPYSQPSPLLQTNGILNTGQFFQYPLLRATASANHTAAGAKFVNSEWNGSAAQNSSWTLVPTLAASGVPLFENFNLTNSGSVTRNLNFIIQYPIRLGLQNASSFNTFFVANPAAPSQGVTVTGPPSTGTLSTGAICGTVAANGACSNTIGNGSHSIAGIAALSDGTSTITGISPAFTSTSSYYCITNDITNSANPSKGVPASARAITFTGTGTDQIQFICVGN
jgi:hypothetical protein